MFLAEEGIAKVPGWSLDTLQEEKGNDSSTQLARGQQIEISLEI